MPDTGVRVVEWRPITKNTLRGFITVQFPSGMIVHDVAVHSSHGAAWASPPSKPMLDRAGQPMRDEGGKQRWQPIISFSARRVREQWSGAVIAALQAAHPAALMASQYA